MKTIYFLIFVSLLISQIANAQSRLVIENLKTGKKFTYPSKASMAIQLKSQSNEWLEGKITEFNRTHLTLKCFTYPDSINPISGKERQIQLADIKAFSPQWNSRRPVFNAQKIIVGTVLFVLVAPLSLNNKYGTNWLNLAGYGTGGALLFAWGILDNRRMEKKTQDFSAKYYKFYLKN
ncbi:MAG: hypothetical protein MUE85_08615 [Microscillaceae bacterium]|nr:hypothetical protein [Microscillaceae bacterium]